MPITVLQVFHTYLKTTENWSYNIISNFINTNIIVGSKRFEKCNFYNSKFKYIEFPLRQIEEEIPSYLVKKYNKFVRSMLRHFYPGYVRRFAGPIQLVHSHFSFVGWEYRSVAQELKIPHIVSFYGFDYEWLPFNDPKWVVRYQKLFSEVDLFLCEGNHGARILAANGCPEEKIRVARLGVTVSKIPFFSRAKRPDELHLLQVASITTKKGHRYTLEAFLRALPECPEMSLTLVGRDSDGLKADLLQLIEPMLIGTKIHFIDQIDFEQLHPFMSNYQVFIHPSCYSDDRDCEGGAPVVLLDAQATGMPVIASTHCDIPEVVIDSVTGLLTGEKEVEPLVNSIKRFYRMGQQEYSLFSDAARSHVEEKYDVVQNAKVVENIYNEMIAQRDHQITLQT